MDESITSGKFLFVTDDCMGNKIGLKPETYYLKILPKHTEMTVDIIREGVESAHLVLLDEIPNRYDYFKMIPNPVQGRNDLTNSKVVVETNISSEISEIVTGHLMRNTKNEMIGGGIIYDAGSASKRGIRFKV